MRKLNLSTLGWQRCAELLTMQFFKVNLKNVLNSFWAVFCCKVGACYGFNSEIGYQSRCRDKKKCHFKVLKVLKVLKNKNKT